MPTTLKTAFAALAVAVGVAACGDARANDADQAELRRDLELASSTVSLAGPRVDSALLNSMETKPQGAPEAAPVVKKGAGPRAVRSRTPTVRATPEIEVAALDEAEEVVEVETEAPAPEEITEPVAVAPRPQPVIIQTGGTGDYGTGSGGVYGGGGGVFGGGTGVIIRGGGIDGDNCELHRTGGRRTRGPIFIPTTNVPTTAGTIINRPPSRPTSGGVGSRGGGIGSRTASTRSSASGARPSSPRGMISRGGR